MEKEQEKEKSLNCTEIAFLMSISLKESKALFCKILQVEKINMKDEIEFSKFIGKFGLTMSFDLRFDKLDKFNFYIESFGENYKKYLSDKKSVSKGFFVGKLTLFNKICNENQVLHFTDLLNKKFELRKVRRL